MLTLVFSAALIFSIYTLAALSFFPRASYEELEYKMKSMPKDKFRFRNYFAKMYLISTLVGMLLTATVVYFFIY